jgi:hypothetical protein
VRPIIPIGWRVTDDRESTPRHFVNMPDGTGEPIKIGKSVPSVRGEELVPPNHTQATEHRVTPLPIKGDSP